MDSSANPWLSEMVMDKPVFTDEFDSMNLLEDELDFLLEPDLLDCPSSPERNSNIPISYTSFPVMTISREKLPRVQKPNKFVSSFSNAQKNNSSAPIILNFERPNSPPPPSPSPPSPGREEKEPTQRSSKRGKRSVGDRVRDYDHVVAERKRRRQLSQHFGALTAIVPGLKRMDKTSVLGGAITHMKFLKERVQVLEERAREKTIESVVLRTKLDDDGDKTVEQPLPAIEASVLNNQILIRVHCEFRKGLLKNLLHELEKINLTILTTNTILFGKWSFYITMMTEMEKGFNSTVNEVVKRIREALVDTLVN